MEEGWEIPEEEGRQKGLAESAGPETEESRREQFYQETRYLGVQ